MRELNKNSAFVLLPISRGETEEVVKNKMFQLKQKGIDFNVGTDPEQHIAGLYNALNAILLLPDHFDYRSFLFVAVFNQI